MHSLDCGLYRLSGAREQATDRASKQANNQTTNPSNQSSQSINLLDPSIFHQRIEGVPLPNDARGPDERVPAKAVSSDRRIHEATQRAKLLLEVHIKHQSQWLGRSMNSGASRRAGFGGPNDRATRRVDDRRAGQEGTWPRNVSFDCNDTSGRSNLMGSVKTRFSCWGRCSFLGEAAEVCTGGPLDLTASGSV